MSEYRWIDLGNGRRVFRKVKEPNRKRSDLPTPHFISDTMDPVQSMADGKWYTSKSAIRATYKPSGNPQGASYAEIGNDKSWRERERPQPKSDPKAVSDAVDKAFARLESGDLPSP